MCGICGATVEPRAPAAPAVGEVGSMVARLAHRGPGERGVRASGNAVLGTARLHVTDPGSPSGPYATADGAVVAVVNGEIWNHVELREELAARGVAVPAGPDTAVVAPLYATHGASGLGRLRGMFALAIHDARDGATVLARDRFGIKPLYVQRAAEGGGVRFASEAGALPGGGGLDRDALADYLALGFVPAPATLDRAVRKVPPGCALTFRAEGVREVRFAEPPAASPGTRATAGEVRAALGAAVERHLMGDAPIGVYLSGGVDSAAVSALVAAAGVPLRTFALAFPGEGAYDEGAAARRTAELLGARHVEAAMGPADLERLLPLAARHFGEAFGDPSALAVLALSKAAAEEVTVVLTGTGADELFCGYRRYRLPHLPPGGRALAGIAGALLPRSRRRAAGVAGAHLRKLARTAAGTPARRYLAALEVVPAGWRARLLGAQVDPPVLHRFEQAFRDAGTFADAARRCDLAVYLPDDVLAKEDRMAMAASLENRVPFLDDALADLAGRLPAAEHLRGPGAARGKALLRRALSGDLPDEVRGRRKHGFAVPVSEWLRGPCRGLVDEHLLPRDARIADHLDRGAIRELALAHRRGDDDLGLAVHALVALEAALRSPRSA